MKRPRPSGSPIELSKDALISCAPPISLIAASRQRGMYRISLALLLVTLSLFLSTELHAQTSDHGRFQLNVNAGGRMQSHALTTSTTFPIYGQIASVTTAQATGKGPLFDLNGGIGVLPRVSIVLGFSSVSTSEILRGRASSSCSTSECPTGDLRSRDQRYAPTSARFSKTNGSRTPAPEIFFRSDGATVIDGDATGSGSMAT